MGRAALSLSLSKTPTAYPFSVTPAAAKAAVYTLFAAAVAATIAWLLAQEPAAVGLLALLIPLWRYAPNRYAAALILLVFYLVLSRDLPDAYLGFFTKGRLLDGVGLWAAASGLLTLPWLLLWGRAGWVWRVPLLLLILLLPPLGLIGWAHPLFAAGVVLPGTGLYGLVGFLLLCWLSTVSAPIALTVAFSIIVAVIGYQPPSTPSGAVGLTTQLPALHPQDYLQTFERNSTLQRELAKTAKHHKLIVTPESIGGLWTRANRASWRPLARQLKQQGVTLLLGVDFPADPPNQPATGLVALGSQNFTAQQMVPVPLVLWRPWGKPSAPLTLFTELPQLLLDGGQHHILICYEQLIYWGWLRQSLKSTPKTVIAISNHWWAKSVDLGSVAAAQRHLSQAVARLHGATFLSAINH